MVAVAVVVARWQWVRSLRVARRGPSRIVDERTRMRYMRYGMNGAAPRAVMSLTRLHAARSLIVITTDCRNTCRTCPVQDALSMSHKENCRVPRMCACPGQTQLPPGICTVFATAQALTQHYTTTPHLTQHVQVHRFVNVTGNAYVETFVGTAFCCVHSLRKCAGLVGTAASQRTWSIPRMCACLGPTRQPHGMCRAIKDYHRQKHPDIV